MAIPFSRTRCRTSPLALALLLLLVAAAALPQAALAASGGVMGGRSSSSRSRSSSASSSSRRSTSSSYSYSSTHMSFGRPYTRAAPSSYYPYSSSSSTASSVGTFLGCLVVAVICFVFVCAVVGKCSRPKTSVVKLQVALLGVAKTFQKDLSQIAEGVEIYDQRWYKFILTETICSLRRHKNCHISSSLSVYDKDVDSWEEHFDKISIEERSKFDEETLYNLEGIKRKNRYSKLPDGSGNEYIVVTILLSTDEAPEFPEAGSTGYLQGVLEKLNSIPEREIRGIQVLWTPEDENDVLSEERLLWDYPNLKPPYYDYSK